jgi:type 1 glutamine amidotransferase
MTTRALLAASAIALVGCGTPAAPAPGTPIPEAGTSPIRVLAVTATAGFRHASIPTARQTLASMAADTGEFVVTATESLGDISAARLGSVDVLMFALTSGELALDAAQKAALLAFVNGGGGFVGVHSATDTFYTWPEYGQLVGAYFKEHPWTQEAAVRVEAPAHPAGRGLGPSFRLLEEFYTFIENPRPRVQVILSLDGSSVGADGDFPLAWAQTVGQGRSFYTALGHFDSTWMDARFQAHLRGAIAWTAKRE